MLHAVCEAYGGYPSERIGIADPKEDRTLAIVFDAEVLVKAREHERKRFEEISGASSDASQIENRYRQSFDEWYTSLPEGDLKNKLSKMKGVSVG